MIANNLDLQRNLTVLRPLTAEEHLEIFYKSWVSPITGIWTFMAGIGAVIAPLIISIYRKRQSEKDKNKTR